MRRRPFNVTDNQSAKVHSSSLASCVLLKESGLDPVLQMTCRDRNRLGLQSDVLGAALLGIKNVVALSGDHPACGDHPHVPPGGRYRFHEPDPHDLHDA